MSGSRVDLDDDELAKEWPYLTRQQLEEYKDAFRIFDRHGQGSFTGADIEWVMRSLGQTPTQKQIEAIIRDMDLDNDGVIDLAEFMIRMMALTTKAAPEEDLKHVFDVLDKGSNGQITADSLRSAIKSIGDWEMTDDEIEIAIKLADKSGDGIIDYDEFIAFVFGDNSTAQRKQQTGIDASQTAVSTAHAELTEVKTSDWVDPAAVAPVQQHDPVHQAPMHSSPAAFAPGPAASGVTDMQTHAAGAALPWLAVDVAPKASDAVTDDWVTAQTHETAVPSELRGAPVVYDNALYQTEASNCPQSAATQPGWQFKQQSLLQQQQQQWQQQQQQQLQQQLQLQPHAVEHMPEQAPLQHTSSDAADADAARLGTFEGDEYARSQGIPAPKQWEQESAPSIRDALQTQASPWQASDAAEGSSMYNHSLALADDIQGQSAAGPDLAAPLHSHQQPSRELELMPTMQQQQQQQPRQEQSVWPIDNAYGQLGDQSHVQSQLGAPEAQLVGESPHDRQHQGEGALQAQEQGADGGQAPAKLPPLPMGKKPGTLPKHPIPPAPPKRKLPGLSSSQLSAGINRAKQQPH